MEALRPGYLLLCQSHPRCFTASTCETTKGRRTKNKTKISHRADRQTETKEEDDTPPHRQTEAHIHIHNLAQHKHNNTHPQLEPSCPHQIANARRCPRGTRSQTRSTQTQASARERRRGSSTLMLLSTLLPRNNNT